MPMQTRSMTRRGQEYADDYDYDYYDEQCNGHDYCGCGLCQIHPKKELCGCSECQVTRKCPTYCHQCSLNIERLVAKYAKNNTKYQKILKSLDFPRDIRSNRLRMINAIKFFLNIIENFVNADLNNFVYCYDMTQYCEVLCPQCQNFYREHSDIESTQKRVSRFRWSRSCSEL